MSKQKDVMVMVNLHTNIKTMKIKMISQTYFLQMAYVH